MMPPRLVPVSCKSLPIAATAVSSTPYPNGATLWVIGDSPFRLAINAEADNTNSIIVYGYTPIFITVPVGGYVSVITYNPSGGPVLVPPPEVHFNEVLIS